MEAYLSRDVYPRSSTLCIHDKQRCTQGHGRGTRLLRESLEGPIRSGTQRCQKIGGELANDTGSTRSGVRHSAQQKLLSSRGSVDVASTDGAVSCLPQYNYQLDA
jgi:hypothetical protein